ncbi:MAG: leucine-rich repeat protein [Clostridia bacterium]|nr:leucine-rich repeat protein [Clostridia bacterium]
MKINKFTIFEKVGKIDKNYVLEADNAYEAARVSREMREKPGHKFLDWLTHGWGVAIICILVSGGVLGGIIYAGQNPPDPPTDTETSESTSEEVTTEAVDLNELSAEEALLFVRNSTENQSDYRMEISVMVDVHEKDKSKENEITIRQVPLRFVILKDGDVKQIFATLYDGEEKIMYYDGTDLLCQIDESQIRINLPKEKIPNFVAAFDGDMSGKWTEEHILEQIWPGLSYFYKTLDKQISEDGSLTVIATDYFSDEEQKVGAEQSWIDGSVKDITMNIHADAQGLATHITMEKTTGVGERDWITEKFLGIKVNTLSKEYVGVSQLTYHIEVDISYEDQNVEAPQKEIHDIRMPWHFLFGENYPFPTYTADFDPVGGDHQMLAYSLLGLYPADITKIAYGKRRVNQEVDAYIIDKQQSLLVFFRLNEEGEEEFSFVFDQNSLKLSKDVVILGGERPPFSVPEPGVYHAYYYLAEYDSSYDNYTFFANTDIVAMTVVEFYDPAVGPGDKVEFSLIYSEGEGDCSVVGYRGVAPETIVVPETSPDGRRVTRIESGAFFQAILTKSVILPDSILGIGDRAFQACMSLESVTMSPTVVLGEDVFIGTPLEPPPQGDQPDVN